jgi:hypothetical protein
MTYAFFQPCSSTELIINDINEMDELEQEEREK